ncbi:MAG: hypothetical protein L0Y72_24465 [Gemmataceae bacterium]|nr:hypothetical protein [Gemmataceae bacterium]MCI0742200.1 hypothetical protein [Gemmataceae bacterium]
MAGLTITEKEHWKERIARRIGKKIEALCVQDPNFMERIQRQAHTRALESLGLAQLQAELDAIEKEEEALKKRKEQTENVMLARVQGVPIEEVDRGYQCYGGQHPEVTKALKRRRSVHEDELLAEQAGVGQQILKLRKDREELLDTVWLATSGKQIRDLWVKVSELLGEEPSTLQRDALAIAPSE